jgi:hypothetical protein
MSRNALFSVLRVLLLPLLGVTACEQPLAPNPRKSASPSRSAQIVPKGKEPVDFGDVRGRMLPAFEDEALSSLILRSLDDFEAAYAADDDVSARRALMFMRESIAGSHEHPANLTAFKRTLLQAESLLPRLETDSGLAER